MSRKQKFFLLALIVATVAGIMMISRGHDVLTQEKIAARKVTADQKAADDGTAAILAEDEAELNRALQDDELLTQKELERKSFAKMLDEARKTLPTKDQLKKTAVEEAEHDTPTVIIQAAAHIGELKQSVDHDPELAPEAASFYLDCAKAPEIVSSIRALCLSNLLNLARGQIAIDMDGVASIPKDIVELSSRIKNEQTEKN